MRTSIERLSRGFVAACLAAVATGHVAAAASGQQIPQAPGASGSCPSQWTALRDNGIAVGEPKVFDNRTLTLMLESLAQQLAQVQLINGADIASHLGQLQGYESSDIARSLRAQSAALPGTTSSTERQSGFDSATRERTLQTTRNNDGTVREETVKQTAPTASTDTTVKSETTTPQRDPLIPAVPAALASPAFTPQFGANAADALAEQVNLSYQIFNVRMLLERAVTDRIWSDGKPRLQAVVGFNISLDPPKDAEDAAAVVEITVKPVNAEQPVSVVALMPQEKTYNSAALSTRSSDFGGSAVARVFTVGYAEQRRSQTFYLYRDNDTLAFERMDQPTQQQARFGWQFRPVLGRRSVSPGTRQMFAVLAAPAADERIDAQAFNARVSVRTYWTRYYRKTLTTGTEDPWRTIARFASLGLVKRPLLKDVVETCFRSTLGVPATTGYQSALEPGIDDIAVHKTGNDIGVVSIKGKNLFSGTAIRLGGRTYASAADGLILKSDQAIDLIAPLSSLANDEGVLVGRYGSAIRLVVPEPTPVANQQNQGSPPAALHIVKTSSSVQPLGGKYVLDLYVVRGDNQSLTTADLPHSELLVALEGKIIPGPYELANELIHPSANAPLVAGVRVRLYPAAADFKYLEGLLTLRFPLQRDIWRTQTQIYDPESVYQVLITGHSASRTTYLIGSSDSSISFDHHWRLALGGVRPLIGKSTGVEGTLVGRFVQLTVDDTIVKDTERALLIEPNDATHEITLPESAAAADEPKPGVSAGQTFSVGQFDAVRLTVLGTKLNVVKWVAADANRLTAQPSKDGKTLTIYLTRALTSRPGTVALVLRDTKGGVVDTIDLTIVANR